ncbi:hypothetical protein [Neisseria shayeganii]|uniref:Lipoprotein n=1 Tax=Neisseria shayeganii 871 TaxID=1032488 RepID=G4CHE5_9NEIS|nr:hypothetical protein [Neisseria shayeganii]EGY52757.1 hypothetical protein HMPREF9371_1034 [Neisseria shayeganii 871]
MTKKLLASALLSVVLGACATTAPDGNVPANTAALSAAADYAGKQLRQSEQKIIAYYNADGELAQQPMRGGYYRMLLGRNADGKAVVQDFYQDSQTKQINAVVVPDDKDLQNFDVAVTEGRTIWYTPEGRVTNFVDIQNGKSLRSGYYDEQGRLALSIEGDQQSNKWSMSGFYENGKPVFMMRTQNGKIDMLYFYESGGKMAHVNQAEGNTAFWKEDGSQAESGDAVPALRKTLERSEYLTRKYLR